MDKKKYEKFEKFVFDREVPRRVIKDNVEFTIGDNKYHLEVIFSGSFRNSWLIKEYNIHNQNYVIINVSKISNGDNWRLARIEKPFENYKVILISKLLSSPGVPLKKIDVDNVNNLLLSLIVKYNIGSETTFKYGFDGYPPGV